MPALARNYTSGAQGTRPSRRHLPPGEPVVRVVCASLALLISSVAIGGSPAPKESVSSEYVAVPGEETSGESGARSENAPTAAKLLSSLPARIEPNRGQADPRFPYVGRAANYTVSFAKDAVLFGLPAPRDDLPRDKALPRARTAPEGPIGHNGTSLVIKVAFAGADPKARLLAEEPQAGISNYYKGQDPSKWITGVEGYSALRYSELFKGTDLVFRDDNGIFSFSLYLKPGSKPRPFAFHIEGHSGLAISQEGHLRIESPSGDLVFEKPRAFQSSAAHGDSVPVQYELLGAGGVSLSLGHYDTTQELVVDPAIRWSTYLGGTYEEYGAEIASDASGTPYLLGTTRSSDFPTTPPSDHGPYASPLFEDVFVTRLSREGDSLIYSTYFGGSNLDYGTDIAVDPTGSAYVTGRTLSVNFPTTFEAFDTRCEGSTVFATWEGFVARIDPRGRFVYSSCIGGSSHDDAYGIAADESGYAYVVGSASPPGFSGTPGAYDEDPGEYGDAFVLKVGPSGRELSFLTFLGGSKGDEGLDVALDTDGGIVVVGETESPDFPITEGAVDSIFGGLAEGFLAKLSGDGAQLAYGTYLGGNGGADSVGEVVFDARGFAVVAGATSSPDFPTTGGAAGGSSGDGTGRRAEAFAAKIDVQKRKLEFSAVIGGIGDDVANGIATDLDGRVYVVGSTTSTDFPVTPGAISTSYGGGVSDAFVTIISADGGEFTYSSFLGGREFDFAVDVAVVPGHGLYASGYTESADFPVTRSSYDTNLAELDVFLVAFTMPCDESTRTGTRYLVEGSTQAGFEEWIVIANPDPEMPSVVCLAVISDREVVGIKEFEIGPRSRIAVPMHKLAYLTEVSVRVDLHGPPVEVERAVYVDSGTRRGAHLGTAQGLDDVGGTIHLAEGTTGEASETWCLVLNPSLTETASVRIRFSTDTGELGGPVMFTMPPSTRRTIRVNDYVPNSYHVSTEVVSDVPVLVERASYIAHSGLRGATASPGVSTLKRKWLLPEGATAGPFEDWILLSNPAEEPAEASITLMTSGGAPRVVPVELGPRTRVSVRADDYVDSYDVAAVVESDRPIAAERALYTRGHPTYGDTASTSEGLTALSTRWIAPEGATDGGFETWTLVSNPDPAETATISIQYMTDRGPVPGPQNRQVAPMSRATFKANDYLYPPTYHAAAIVEVADGPPVGVDHSVYAPPWMPGRDATSGPAIAVGPVSEIP